MGKWANIIPNKLFTKKNKKKVIIPFFEKMSLLHLALDDL